MIAQRTRPRIYLAGPDVFRRNAEAHGQALKAQCLSAGFTPLWPLDPVPVVTAEAGAVPDHLAVARQIYSANIARLLEADAVLANIEPFRGPGMDAGTAMEIGFAVHRGLPVFAYSRDVRPYAERVQPHRTRPGEDMWCRDGLQIENFGLPENLMIAIPVGPVDCSPTEALNRARRILIEGAEAAS